MDGFSYLSGMTKRASYLFKQISVLLQGTEPRYFRVGAHTPRPHGGVGVAYACELLRQSVSSRQKSDGRRETISGS